MKLSKVAPLVRRSINMLLIFAAVYYLGVFVVLPIFRNSLLALFPPKDAPTVKFGILDPLEFVDKPILTQGPNYVLNTKDGRLPQLESKVAVYKFKNSAFSYLDGQHAQDNAKVLGYTDADLITDLKGDEYKWRNAGLNANLDIKIHTRELTNIMPFDGKASLLQSGVLTDEVAVKTAHNLFTDLGRFEDDGYKNGTQTIRYGRIAANKLVETQNPLDIQVAKVDLFRSIDKKPILGPDAKKGLLEAYITIPVSPDGPLKFPRVEAYYSDIDISVFDATYPLVPIAQVWDEILKGNGIVANVTPKNASPFEDYTPVKTDRILINSIYIAYYETPKQQKYLQPIYVFEGNYISPGDSGSITFYYPAVSGQWVKSVQPAAAPSVLPK